VGVGVQSGSFTFYLKDDSIFLYNSDPIVDLIGDGTPPYASFSSNIDGDGDMAGIISSFHSGSRSTTCGAAGTMITTFKFVPFTFVPAFAWLTTGFADPAMETIDLDVTANIEFNVPGFGPCTSPNYTFAATGTINRNDCPGADLGSGEFCLEATDIVTAQFGAMACGGAGNCINNEYDLGAGDAYFYAHGETSSVIAD
jgi:hypothetical protein